MITLNRKEYDDLLHQANKRATWYYSNLLIPKYYEGGRTEYKQLNISAVDVVHNLILQYPDSSFSFLRSKIGSEYIRIYFDFRKNSEPDFEYNCRKNYNEKIKTDPKFKQHHRERTRDYQRNRKQSDPAYREKYNSYRNEWRKKQRELYGKCPN
jgi:hypothetical protein